MCVCVCVCVFADQHSGVDVDMTGFVDESDHEKVDSLVLDTPPQSQADSAKPPGYTQHAHTHTRI